MSTAQTETKKARGRVRVEVWGKARARLPGRRGRGRHDAPDTGLGGSLLPGLLLPPRRRRSELLSRTEACSFAEPRGRPHFTVRAGGREAPDAALRYDDSPIEELRDAIRLEWEAMDAWFEEDEEVFTHPRDPTPASTSCPAPGTCGSRWTVSRSPSRPPAAALRDRPAGATTCRRPHVRMDLLEPTETASHCPYKGEAE